MKEWSARRADRGGEAVGGDEHDQRSRSQNRRGATRRPECERARDAERERQPEEDHQARPHQRPVVRIVDVPEHTPPAAEVRGELVPVPGQGQPSRQPHRHRAHGDREQDHERGKGPGQPPGHPVASERHQRRGARNHRDQHQHRPARGRIDDHAEPRDGDIRRERREGQQPDQRGEGAREGRAADRALGTGSGSGRRAPGALMPPAPPPRRGSSTPIRFPLQPATVNAGSPTSSGYGVTT